MKGRQRLLSNYFRLTTTFVTGLIVVRLVAEIGASALTVYLLIVAGTGFALSFKVVTQESVVPVLGLSFNEKGARSFDNIYWVSFILGVLSCFFGAMVFWIVWCSREFFQTGSISETTLAVALISGVLRTSASSLATPPLQAILVSGRIVIYNILLATERLADLLSVCFVLMVFNEYSENMQVAIFFALSSAIYSVVNLLIYLFAKEVDDRFRFKKTFVSENNWRWVAEVFGWNAAVVLAFLLYLRLSTFVVNSHFGEGPTLIFGLVILLIGYQRQISMGLVIGLDALVSRLYGDEQSEYHRVRKADQILYRSSYIQGLFSFTSVVIIWVLAEPIFRIWLGSSLEGSGWDTADAANLFRFMAIGVLARSISENWMKFLNGQGKSGLYASWQLAGGVVFALLLLGWSITGTSADDVLTRVAIAFSILYSVVHLGVIPLKLCKLQGIRIIALVKLAIIPGVIVLVVASVIAVPLQPESNVSGALVWLFAIGSMVALFIFRSEPYHWVSERNYLYRK